MKTVGKRIRELRMSVKLPQAKMGELVGAKQSSLNRYELGVTSPPLEVLLKCAEYFDVSLDYIFGRTDKPQGVLYEYHPKIAGESKEMKRFVEMCFDPASPMNERLKKTLIQMLEEARE